jgi:hypothetical protein
MSLFAYQPKGHGEYSFFVAAENEKEAKESVDKYIARHLNKEDEECLDDCAISGWGTDYYSLTVVDEGEVIANAND